MQDQELFALVFQGKRELGVNSKKFAGSLTVEMLKHAVETHGILVSPRDVFIRGIGVEIDLLLLKKANPKYGLLYEPKDVLAVLEVKELGSWGQQTLNQIRRNFELIRRISNDIYCAYVTLTERRGFKQAITTENLGFPAYTLFCHRGNDVENAEPTGDFERLLNDLRKLAV